MNNNGYNLTVDGNISDWDSKVMDEYISAG
jgi:hypothetical protein